MSNIRYLELIGAVYCAQLCPTVPVWQGQGHGSSGTPEDTRGHPKQIGISPGASGDHESVIVNEPMTNSPQVDKFAKHSSDIPAVVPGCCSFQEYNLDAQSWYSSAFLTR